MPRIIRFLFVLLITTVRSRATLQLKVAALQHQLAVYKAKGRRPQIKPTDRILWAALARWWPRWRDALHFVQPQTVIAWQRKRFRKHWLALSKNSRPGRPSIAPELRLLIQQMWRANPTWGSPRIVGELKKLGIDVAKNQRWRNTGRTVAIHRHRHGVSFSINM